ncbi:hypothetical protein NLU13_4644 [Sarocladium strictum]|uniref:Uncharacterized protein n=1 Tax=Sarocladium strictum TaxID=5046 RepID=A0AA39L907_SARSR|nr:hypothetical protein NLU13_4644 [Sarocladium strictum]
MEQRDLVPSPRSTSRPRQTRAKNTSQQQHRDPHLAASLPVPATARAPTPQISEYLENEDVSVSEPFLRFPRPQGNKRLAKWISSSDPNIMDLSSDNNSEPGLEGSTYELISKEESAPNAHPMSTDSELQDDSQQDFDESVSESVGSLDQFRQDDVQSLASTDHIEDEEEDGFQNHYDDDDENDDVSTTPDDERSRLTDVTVVNQEGDRPAPHDFEDDQEVSDAESRSSIEYTRQSLGTPSILTPEASKILSPLRGGVHETIGQLRLSNMSSRDSESERNSEVSIGRKLGGLASSLLPHPPARNDQKAWRKYRDEHWLAYNTWQAFDVLRENPRQIVVSIFTVILASVILAYADGLRAQNAHQADFISVETATTTTTVIVESTILVPSVETKQAVHSSTGVALIPIHESHGEEGLFGYSLPLVSFTPEGQTGVLIRADPSIPKTWKAQRECVKIHATRGEKTVPLNVSFTSSNIIAADIPKAEAHGIVQIKLSSKCRPKFEKSVKLHFCKGVIEQAFDRVGEIAHALKGFQPEQLRNVDSSKALRSMSDNVDRTLTSAKEKGVEMVTSQWAVACQMLGPLGLSMMQASQEVSRRYHQAGEVVKTMSGRAEKPFLELKRQGLRITHNSIQSSRKYLGKAQDNLAGNVHSALQKAATSQRAHQIHLQQAVSAFDVEAMQKQLRFGLLDAQVAAKTWWLKATGRADQSKEYGRRAKEFIAELHAFASHESSSAKKGTAQVKSGHCSRENCKNKCKSSGTGQGRKTHQCVAAA